MTYNVFGAWDVKPSTQSVNLEALAETIQVVRSSAKIITE